MGVSRAGVREVNGAEIVAGFVALVVGAAAFELADDSVVRAAGLAVSVGGALLMWRNAPEID